MFNISEDSLADYRSTIQNSASNSIISELCDYYLFGLHDSSIYGSLCLRGVCMHTENIWGVEVEVCKRHWRIDKNTLIFSDNKEYVKGLLYEV